MGKLTAKSTLSGFAHHLVYNNLVDEATVQEALEQAAADKTSYIFHLAQQKLATRKIAQAISLYFGFPIIDLDACNKKLIPSELLNIPLVQKRQALPLFKDEKHVVLAVADPTMTSLDDIKFLTGLNKQLVIAEADKLMQWIDTLIGDQLLAGLGDLNDAALDEVNTSAYNESQTTDTTELDVNTTPVVRYINKILLDAIKENASDIHFEPYDNHYRIRYRQDGLLHKIANPPVKISNSLVARIKVMSNLDISERRVPQDGRFKLILSDTRSIDFRASSCPTLFGEKVVLRILNSFQAVQSDDLGMEQQQREFFQNALEHAQGMILVCGPTGSGKTVTLYTALGILNTMEKNISTVEDPVEIPVQGINQVHVNVKAGLTFANAMRSFLRQDPDIIMVGEIRDLETADIAVKAAQTGHLVLSTVHTNSAAATIVRLVNMGVAPYNLASSIILIIAQRLLRKLCNSCKKPISIPKTVLVREGFKEAELESLTLYGPGSCEYCLNGYKGRTGIFEVMPISAEIEQKIMNGGSVIELEEQARREGILSLRDAGLNKVKQGITSLEELNRVIR